MCALNTIRPRAEYSCAQKDLYTIIRTGWISYEEQLPAFMAYKTSYTATTGTDQLAALETARLMPDQDSRTDLHKSLRIAMIPKAELCIRMWTDLSSYIRDGFAPEYYDTKRLSAGYAYFNGALGMDWDSVAELMVQGLAFADSNTAALTAGGMPATFITDMQTAKDDFETNYAEFLTTLEDTKRMVDEKIVANNTLFSTMMAMFEDAKKIFRDNAALREQFIYERLLAMINPPGGGGGVPEADTVFFGHVVDIYGNTQVGATVRFISPESSFQTQTDEHGNYRLLTPGLEQPVSGDLTAEAMGMMPSSRPVNIVPGEQQEQNFQLSPMTPPPPAP